MLNKSEIAILTIAVSIGSQNYFKMKQCRHFMQITYSPNNVLITMSCRLRGGCERLRLTLFRQTTLEFLAEAARNFRDAVHDALPGSAKGGSLESHTDSSRQQPSAQTDIWQARPNCLSRYWSGDRL